MYAFISYSNSDRVIAAQVKELLAELGVSCFMAHEDIQVSHEWRTVLLEELGKADLFVAILSERYYQSVWCVQESGIAAFRPDVTTIPLSIDGAIPQGFIGYLQSTRIDPAHIGIKSLFPGLARKSVAFVVDAITQMLSRSGSFRGAEADFELILPYLSKATDAQIVKLLTVSTANKQVLHASLCARKFLPPLFLSHGHLMKESDREEMESSLKLYAPEAFGIGG